MRKKFTLMMLAAIFMVAGSFAQGKVSTLPLPQKYAEATTLLAGKNVKKQPAQKALQMQKGMEAQKSLRQSTALHNKAAKKTVAKKQPAAKRRATDIISEQPEGRQVLYNRSGDAYYPFWSYVFNTSLSGAVGNVVFGENNEVYIRNIVSQANTGTWVKGTLDGSVITIELPQTAITYPDYGYGLEVARVEYDAAQQWFFKSDDQTLKLNYDTTTGDITASEDEIIGLTYDDDDSWSGYADYNIVFSAVTDKLVEAPADLETAEYALTAEGYAGSLVHVGFVGNDVYVQGIDANLPENWIKGTVEGDKVIFKAGQYIGADEVAGYHQYLMSATGEELYDDYYEEYYTEYTLTDADIEFTYDAATKTLSNSSLFLINAGKETVNYFAVLEGAKIAPFVEVAAEPAVPTINELYEGGVSYFANGYGWGYLSFDLNTSDIDGNYILPEKLSYQAYVKVNGEVRPLTFSWWDYMYLPEETMSEVPFGFSDGWDFSASGLQQDFYYYVIGPEAYGVQAIYRGAGEEHRSAIAWAEVLDLGADVQPAAATPAYPDATIAETDNRIAYGFYTGDEDIDGVTNNFKPETYDVAIKLSDPALKGSLIESITFPLQEVNGVSDLKVFLTSQLRVEEGKNAADLVVKSVEPAEAGFITVKLDKPYTIPEGGVYVGYSMTVNDVEEEANQNPIAITDKVNEGGFFLHTSDGFLKWLDVATMYAGSAAIEVLLAGEAVKANAVSIAEGDKLYVMAGEEFTAPVKVINHGAKGIQSLDIEYAVAGMTNTIPVTVDVDAFFGKTASVNLTIPAISEKGNYELSLKVAKVNGSANEDAAASNTQPVIALNSVPKHRVLLEEYTGFWCGWCPRGFVGLEKLAELYPDDYVLVSYHNGDELEIMASSAFPSAVAGFPDAWMERATELDAYYGTGNKEFGVADDLAAQAKTFGIANIDLSAKLNATKANVVVNTEVTFPFDVEEGTYALEYILTADGLTDASWGQSNYYAGGAQGTPQYMDQFTTTDESTLYGLTFNDVAVMTSKIGGIANSIPATVKADEPVKHTYTFTLSRAKNTSGANVIQNKENLKVVALLIDTTTGAVVNANKVKIGESTGIEELSNGSKAAQVVYYDLSGRRVLAPAKGMYIKSTLTGGKTVSEKVLMK